jgi:hypothetical protein
MSGFVVGQDPVQNGEILNLTVEITSNITENLEFSIVKYARITV